MNILRKGASGPAMKKRLRGVKAGEHLLLKIQRGATACSSSISWLAPEARSIREGDLHRVL